MEQVFQVLEALLSAVPLETLFGIMPQRWVAFIGALLVVGTAMRTLLRVLVAACYALDYALDGSYDWQWVGRVGDWLDRLDDKLERLPVKPPFVRGKK